MNFKNTTTHYNTFSIALHWLMFILIVTVYGSIELRELFDKGTATRDAFNNQRGQILTSDIKARTLRVLVSKQRLKTQKLIQF